MCLPLWYPSSHPWCQVWWSPVLSALCVLEGHQGWGQWQWQWVGVCSFFLHWEPQFCFWREKLLHSLGFSQIELGRFHTTSPNTEGELGVICLLLFRLPMSNSCFIVTFPLGITKLKLAGWISVVYAAIDRNIISFLWLLRVFCFFPFFFSPLAY